MFDPTTATFVLDPRDRLRLSMPHATCDRCKRRYEAQTLVELHARECRECLARRRPVITNIPG